MKTYNQINLSQISEILIQAALGVSAVCGYKYVTSDMVYSLQELSTNIHTETKEPYYIAIREQGTESGFRDYCIARCKSLGYPIIIAKIERDKTFDLNMTITYTHGWMDKDNRYMEQEFDSL